MRTTVLCSLTSAIFAAACINSDSAAPAADHPDVAPQPQPPPTAPSACPPPSLSDRGLCVCENLDQVGSLRVTGISGSASVGVNGRTALVGSAVVEGDLVSYQSFSAVGGSVGDSLATSGDLTFTGDLDVGGDVTVGGNLRCVGDVTIGGALGLAGTRHITGDSSIAALGAYVAPTEPCDCNPSTLYDVLGVISAAATSPGIITSAGWHDVGSTEVHLTGGAYYVTAADIVGEAQIFIDQSSTVYVDGSLDTVGEEQWHIAPGATLDLYVSGDVRAVGQLIAGNANDTAAFHLYIGGGGDSGLSLVGDGNFYGSIYAPRASLRYTGDLHVIGWIFARTLHGVGELFIEHDAPPHQPPGCDAVLY